MTNFLLRLFVKDCKDPQSPAVHSAIGKLAGITGIVCNCLLAAGKLIVGLTTGSVAIVSDGVNSLSDAVSSVIAVLGFRLAQHPADKDHPYGHARFEYLSGLAVAALILLAGAALVKSSVSKILLPVPLDISAGTIAVLLISVVAKLWMSVFFRTLGNQIRSAVLLAAAADSRNDMITSSAVLLGCLFNKLFHLNIDGYLGLAVACFILYSGIQIAKDTISPILGKQADKELVGDISSLILSHEKVLGIHDLLVHDYGPGQCYASVHVEMSAEEHPLACHDAIDAIERHALEALHVHLVIHYDPVVNDDAEQNEMYLVMQGILSGLDPQISLHDFRIARDSVPPKLVFDLSLPYAMAQQHREIKQKIDNELLRRNLSYTTVIHFEGNS